MGKRVEKENNYRVRDIYSDIAAGSIRKRILLCDNGEYADIFRD